MVSYYLCDILLNYVYLRYYNVIAAVRTGLHSTDKPQDKNHIKIYSDKRINYYAYANLPTQDTRNLASVNVNSVKCYTIY